VAASTIKVKLVRSGIGYPPDQRATLRGLGLSRINQERELEDTPAVRGMVFKVKHLVQADPPEAAQRKR
jgi:large subunit ribosomal protein L30